MTQRLLSLLVLAVLCWSPSCKFPELPPLDEDGGTDAASVMCVDMGSDSPDPSCPPGRPLCVDGTCGGQCASNADCAVRPVLEAVCHVPSGHCVSCDEEDEQAEPGSVEDDCSTAGAPVCDSAGHACRPCADNAECFLGVCDAGRCATASEIIHMSANGTDGINNCDNPASGAGCLTLEFALGKVSAIRKFIVMQPSASPYFARSTSDRADFNGVAVRVIGNGAALRRAGINDGEVIEVRAGANVVIEGLTVENARGSSLGTGIKVVDSRLELFRARVQNNTFRGISASNATLRITRSVISGNAGGGVFLDGGTLFVVNNIVWNNGSSLSTFGGMSLLSMGTSTLEFNTIVDNNAMSGTADGLTCFNSNLMSRNNIIHGDLGEPHVAGNCSHRSTLYGPDGTLAGTMNVLVADKMTYRFTADRHLDPNATPPSVAAGAADPTGLVGETLFDLDGEARGTTGVDVGADEIP